MLLVEQKNRSAPGLIPFMLPKEYTSPVNMNQAVLCSLMKHCCMVALKQGDAISRNAIRK